MRTRIGPDKADLPRMHKSVDSRPACLAWSGPRYREVSFANVQDRSDTREAQPDRPGTNGLADAETVA
ncbi:hypothetical protein GCM10027213_57990 [Mycobacterium bourgelatii]